ncbi:hypothetical protein AB0H63_23795 [Micromonospora echinospora]|uniref:hypothetical protein n=1 Tax=Micromonospora echinospora TaxID=1877 RepID=UPI0033E4154C
MTMDDEQVTGMLRRLGEGPHRPPRVDVSRAVRDGRRRRRARRVVGAGSTTLAVALAVVVAVPVLRDAGRSDGAPMAAAAPASCAVETLPLPAGAASGSVAGGDPTGRYLVGSVARANLSSRWPALWVDGRVRELPAATRSLSLTDVTSSGQVIARGGDGGNVGYVYQFDTQDRSDVDRSGAVRPLPGGPGRRPVAISEAGRIVGNRLLAGRDNPNLSVPVVWASSTSAPTDLPLPGPGWTGMAEDIGDDGTVVGMVGEGRTFQRGYLWRSDGTGEFLPTPPGAGAFWPVSVRGSWVVGTTQPGQSAMAVRQTVRLNLTTGEFVPLPQPAEQFTAVIGNARGWAGGLIDRSRAGLLTDAGLRELPLPRIDPTSSPVSGTVSVVSDDGRTLAGAGTIGSAEGQPPQTGKPLRWTCR